MIFSIFCDKNLKLDDQELYIKLCFFQRYCCGDLDILGRGNQFYDKKENMTVEFLISHLPFQKY